MKNIREPPPGTTSPPKWDKETSLPRAKKALSTEARYAGTIANVACQDILIASLRLLIQV